MRDETDHASPVGRQGYRWRRGCSTVSACGVGVATLTWGPTAALVVFVVLLLVACAGLTAVAPFCFSSELSGRELLRRGGALSCAGIALVAFFMLSGALAAAAGLCALITSPPVARLLARATGPSSADAPTGDVGPGGDLETWSDAELCRAWRRSVKDLGPQSTADPLLVVSVRAALLDELARRHPAAVRRWLESGGHPSRSPQLDG